MAGIATGQEGGHNLNVELNLVPFIDLLSSLVLFLLVTAVWLQISVIPAAIRNPGRTAAMISKPDDKQLMIRLTNVGYEMTWPPGVTKLPKVIPKVEGNFDKDSLAALASQVSGSDRVTSVAVTGDDAVEYGAVIVAIDTAKNGGFSKVALSTN